MGPLDQSNATHSLSLWPPLNRHIFRRRRDTTNQNQTTKPSCPPSRDIRHTAAPCRYSPSGTSARPCCWVFQLVGHSQLMCQQVCCSAGDCFWVCYMLNFAALAPFGTLPSLVFHHQACRLSKRHYTRIPTIFVHQLGACYPLCRIAKQSSKTIERSLETAVTRAHFLEAHLDNEAFTKFATLFAVVAVVLTLVASGPLGHCEAMWLRLHDTHSAHFLASRNRSCSLARRSHQAWHRRTMQMDHETPCIACFCYER